MFSWLETTLSHAAEKHEKIWLMFHVPPGIDGYSTMHSVNSSSQGGPPSSASPAMTENSCDQSIVPMWKPFWTDLFDRLIAQYPTTISAIFAGHDHNDDLRLMSAGQANEQFVLIDPPVSPIFGQNPSFRIASVDGRGNLNNQTTWYLTNLATASKSHPGVWMPEYIFTDEWHSQRLDATALNAVYEQVRKEPAASEQWMKLLDVSSTYRPMPANGPRAMECAIRALDLESYKECFCRVP